MRSLQVELGDRSYPIYIGENLLQDTALYAKHVQIRRLQLYMPIR